MPDSVKASCQETCSLYRACSQPPVGARRTIETHRPGPREAEAAAQAATLLSELTRQLKRTGGGSTLLWTDRKVDELCDPTGILTGGLRPVGGFREASSCANGCISFPAGCHRQRTDIRHPADGPGSRGGRAGAREEERAPPPGRPLTWPCPSSSSASPAAGGGGGGGQEGGGPEAGGGGAVPAGAYEEGASGGRARRIRTETRER